jgi:tRNA pseudouridine55 synthase
MTTVKNIEEIDVQNGSILLVDKPLRWTSFDVVNKIKYEIRNRYGYKNFKIGHAGTLDPLATGLLIVCIGKYTKKIPLLQEQVKRYKGAFVVGATTASHDLEKQPENFMPYEHLTPSDILSATNQFTGEIQQFPPAFSAVRVSGKRAFEYARNKMEIVLPAKKITIYSFDITRIDLPKIDFEIVCSKGTYVRAIARDLGKALGCGAYLDSLRRTDIGNFSVDNALEMTPYLHGRKNNASHRKPRDFDLSDNQSE